MEDDQTDPEMVLLVLMERAFKGPTHEGVRILDWAPQLKRVLKCVRENDPMTMELRGEIERLRAELEASETELRIVRASQAESNAEVERLRAELAECRKELARVPMLLRHYADSTNGQRAIAAQKLAAFFDQRYAALAAKGE